MVLFWLLAVCSLRWTWLICDAVVRLEMVYGLGTVALMQGQMARVDAFQMRGLRHILKMWHRYVDPANIIRG